MVKMNSESLYLRVRDPGPDGNKYAIVGAFRTLETYLSTSSHDATDKL